MRFGQIGYQSLGELLPFFGLRHSYLRKEGTGTMMGFEESCQRLPAFGKLRESHQAGKLLHDGDSVSMQRDLDKRLEKIALREFAPSREGEVRYA